MVSRVFPDANVLYSRTLRDWLFKLSLQAEGGIFRLYWTEDVYVEVAANLRRSFPHLSGNELAELRRRFEGVLAGGKVENYTPSRESPFSDEKDHHIDAAARTCGAHYVVTSDSGFFSPAVDPDMLPYEVYKPDDFFMLVAGSAGEAVREVAKSEYEYQRRRRGPITSRYLSEALESADCPQFAQEVLQVVTRLPASPGSV